MMDLAFVGDMDLIATNSIYRFDRNTANVMKTIKALRDINVEIYFKKENFSTQDPTIDFILNVFYAYVEEAAKQLSTKKTLHHEKDETWW